MVFFCFKQKTAYEMRISDWSSDVCSSDLHARRVRAQGRRDGNLRPELLVGYPAGRPRKGAPDGWLEAPGGRCRSCRHQDHWLQFFNRRRLGLATPSRRARWRGYVGVRRHELRRTGADRSEEHTSELQSLMRNSYAVFCLKKKNTPHKS